MTLRGSCEADIASAYDVSGRMKKAVSLGRIAFSWGGGRKKKTGSFEVRDYSKLYILSLDNHSMVLDLRN